MGYSASAMDDRESEEAAGPAGGETVTLPGAADATRPSPEIAAGTQWIGPDAVRHWLANKHLDP